MLLEAYVLPDIDGATGVVFLNPRPESRTDAVARRESRGPGAATLAVYGPGGVTTADLALASAALSTAAGEGIGASPRWRARLVIWWLGGAIATAGLIWRALDGGPAYAFLAAMAGFLTLPPLWTIDDRPHLWWRNLLFWRTRQVRVSRGTAASLARSLAGLETTAGRHPDTLDQIGALWATSRRADGAPADRLTAMAAHCRDRGWTHVAAWYAARAAAERRAATSIGTTSARWTTFDGGRR